LILRSAIALKKPLNRIGLCWLRARSQRSALGIHAEYILYVQGVKGLLCHAALTADRGYAESFPATLGTFSVLMALQLTDGTGQRLENAG
jgi:hypothetical protein